MTEANMDKYFQPCDPNEFIGQQECLNRFTSLANEFKVNETESRSILVIGNKGTGKSSLLLKFQDLIVARRDKTHVFDLKPDKEMLTQFFDLWLKKIDELVADWSGIFEKMPELTALKEDEQVASETNYVNNYVDKFFEKLDKVDKKLKETKTRLYFFVDNISLFRMMRLVSFYKIYALILEKITSKQYNIFIATAIDEENFADFDYQKKLTENSEIFKLTPLTASESQIFLRRLVPSLMSKGGTELIENSQRTFFDLNLGIAFLKNDLTIHDFVEKNIEKLLNLEKDEKIALSELSTYTENLFPLKRLNRYIDFSTLKKLENKSILWIGKNYARFVQNSLLDVIKFNQRLYSPLTSAMIKLDNILKKVEKNIVPTDIELEEIKKISSTIHEKLAYNVVASKFSVIVRLLIEKEMYQKAYDFTLVNIDNFEYIKDYVRAASVSEKIAREFEEKHYNFAAKLYVNSANFYKSVEEDSKAIRSYARAADQFEKLFESLDPKNNPYIIRAHIKSCLDCYRSANDKKSFVSIKSKALAKFSEDSIHHKYLENLRFEKMDIDSSNLLQKEIDEEQEEKQEPESVDFDELEKELDF